MAICANRRQPYTWARQIIKGWQEWQPKPKICLINRPLILKLGPWGKIGIILGLEGLEPLEEPARLENFMIWGYACVR